MKEWYWSMTKSQKALVYICSTGLILVYAVGLIPLSMLIYQQLGGPPPDA